LSVASQLMTYFGARAMADLCVPDLGLFVMQDKEIGKRVFSIAGSVPASNFVLLPRHRNQNLGLTGQYLYIQVCSYGQHRGI
jgi:hypothetical protein